MDELNKASYNINKIFPKIWRIEEKSCMHLNGYHIMKPCNAQEKKQKHSFQEDHNVLEEVFDHRFLNVVRHSNPIASSNSIENVPITNPVALPSKNNVSDEEVSINSDDCVYAYRGDNFEIFDYKMNNDDETDFLEMDFEPDTDNAIECTSPKSNCSSTRKNKSLMMRKQSLSDEESTDMNNSVVVCIEDNSLAMGAKPKGTCDKITEPIQEPSTSGYSGIWSNSRAKRENILSDTDDQTCFDCLENEFLCTTIGKPPESLECRNCKKYRSISKEMPLNILRVTETKAQSLNLACTKLLAPVKRSTSFSSVRVGEMTIIKALEEIDINFDRGVITKYFEDLYAMREFKNVPELILQESKKNCDYKKIIKLVKLACKDDIDIKFTTIDDSLKSVDVVQIKTSDILRAWASHHDIERLKSFGKKFLQMNILGKVINLIRLAKQRNTVAVGDFLLVPQYYRTGCIYITKK